MPVITKDSQRLIIAFAMAPLVPSATLLLVSLAGNPLEGLWGAAMIAPVSYIAAVCPGAFLYFAARRAGYISAITCTAIGVVCGGVAGVSLMSTSVKHAMEDGSQANWAPSVTVAIIAGLLGGASGYVFWRCLRLGSSPGEP